MIAETDTPPPSSDVDEENAAPTTTPAAADTKPLTHPLLRAFEWVTLRRAIADAEASSPPVEARYLPRALAAYLGAERVIDPANPMREASAGAVAQSLYREALYWSLANLNAKHFEKTTLASAFDGAPRDRLVRAAGNEANLAALRVALVERSFLETGELHPAEQAEEARASRAFVGALLEDATRPVPALTRLKRQRVLRLIGLAVLTIALVVGGNRVAARMLTKKNISAGKSWRTSSTLMTCNPATHECGGNHTDILFHTKEENEPWFEFDLGSPRTVSGIEVANRTDCCAERGYPIVAEVSNDRVKWTEVARQMDRYTVWKARFPNQTARYVRVRSLQKTFLHLEQVVVRGE